MLDVVFRRVLSLNVCKQQEERGDKQQSFHQNLILTVAVIDRMAPAFVGNPYCREPTVVLTPVIAT